MKGSINLNIKLINIVLVVIVYITTILLCGKVIDVNNLFSLKNVLILMGFIIITLILNSITIKMITLPLKKIEKNMRLVASGKVSEPRHLDEYGNLKEIKDFTNAYMDMFQIIQKNSFDLTGQQSKTEIILEHMADGVVAFNVSRQVIHINKSAMRLLALSSTDDTFEKIVKRLKINLDFDKVMYLPNYKTIEAKTTVGGNSLNIVFVPFFSDNLTPMGVIMMVRNITENVKLDNLRKEFVSNVSHELKTPLTSIKGYSETIMNGDLTYEEIKRFSKVINQEANRMGRLVSDLLQLSRFDYKKVSWKKMMFSLDELALGVCEKMRFQAEQKKHKLECIVSNKSAQVYADRDAIERVIINIVSNSIKYTPDGGLITVYVGSVNSNAYFKVVDNGIGIPAKDLDRIFERFYRVDKARSRKAGGTGLGLSIVKEMIEGNNGTIDIRSEVNKGTEVIVTLPTKIDTKK
jgi:two-component system sensor histidine kinase VicK